MKRGNLWTAIIVVCCDAAAALSSGPWDVPVADLPESEDDPAEIQGVTANEVREATTWASQEWQETAPIFTEEETRELQSGTNASDNLCIWGRLVPELLIIGSMKAATTSLSQCLRFSPSVVFPPNSRGKSEEKYPPRWKEGHYFDNYQHLGMTYLLSHSPPCEKSVRRVHVDASARYGIDEKVPGVLRGWYGLLAPRLKFVLTMRDPLARLHSHYYHAVELMFCPDIMDMSFADVLDVIMTNETYRARWMGGRTSFKERCGDFIEGSLYTNHIKHYFEYFEPSQFTFVPFLFVAAPGQGGRPEASVSSALWEMLGVRGLEAPPALHGNVRKHPALADDAAPEKLAFVADWLNNLTGPEEIAHLLQGTDAKLYGFRNNVKLLNSDNPAEFVPTMDIADWIRNNW